MERLPISVVVIARNAAGILPGCLEAIKSNNPVEIVVIDGNSTDNTVEIASRYTKLIFSDEGKGAAFARQMGAEKATQEYLSYVDADILLEKTALATMLKDLQNSNYVSVRAQLQPKNKPSNYWEKSQIEHEKLMVRHYYRLGTPACLLKREVILKNKFDPFMYRGCEDMDLAYRLVKKNYVLGSSTAIAYMGYPPDYKSLVHQRYLWGKGKALIIWKTAPWQAEKWPPVVAAYWFVRSLVKGKPQLIPYFVIGGVAESFGLVIQYFDLIKKG